MSDTIDKLKVIVQHADFTGEQKKGFLQTLEGLGKANLPIINEALEQLLPEAQKNPGKIKEFIWGITKVMLAYVKAGEAGVKQLLEQQVAANQTK